MGSLSSSSLSEQQKKQGMNLNIDEERNAPHSSLNGIAKADWHFDSYIYYLCLYDERVRSFFEKLYELGRKIDKQDVVKYLEIFVEASENYFEEEKKVAFKLDELEKEGLSLTPEYKVGDYGIPIKINAGVYGLDVGCSRCMDFISGFNGIKITYDMLLDEGINPYEVDYQKWEEQNKDIELEKEELEKNISNKKKKLRFSLLGRTSKKEEIAMLEEKLHKIILKIENGKKTKENAMIFANLTGAQKIKLLDYFKSVSRCVECAKQIEKVTGKINDIRDSNVERNKWNRAFESFLELEDFDVSEKVIYINGLILDAFNRKYFPMGAVGISLGSLREVVDWYMNKVYDENLDRVENKKIDLKSMRSL